MRKFAAALFGALFLATAPAALAQVLQSPAPNPDAPRPYGRGKVGGQKVFEQLGLSADQRTRIQQVFEESRQKNAPLYEQMRSLRTEARAAREANDTARFEQVKSQIQALKPQLKQAREESKQQVQAILTPEQRSQLEQLRAQKQQRRQERQLQRQQQPAGTAQPL